MKKTSRYLQQKKQQGQRIVMLTCYDYPTALWEEEAGVDVILVGDSLGTNVLGHVNDVEQGRFPQAAHARRLDKEEADRFARVAESSIRESSAGLSRMRKSNRPSGISLSQRH